MLRCPTHCLVRFYWISFSLCCLDDMNKALARFKATICQLDPCPSWLLKSASMVKVEWSIQIVNSSLHEGYLPSVLKETVIWPILKKVNLSTNDLNNCCLVANIPFMGNLIEKLMAN